MEISAIGVLNSPQGTPHHPRVTVVIKAFFLILIILPSIFFGAYQTSDYFKLRVNNTVTAIYTFNENNFLLWTLPYIILIFGGFIIFLLIRKTKYSKDN